MTNPNKLQFKSVPVGPNEMLARGSSGDLEAKPISDLMLQLMAAETEAQARAIISAAAAGSVAQAGAGSIMIQAGDLAAQQPLPVGNTVQGLSPTDYQLTGWDLWVYPAGSLELDVRKCTLANLPMVPAYSITPSVKPGVTNAETATGDMTNWSSDSVLQSDALSVVITQNTGVRWYTLLLKGTKP